MNDDLDAARLTDRVSALVEAAGKAGADEADAVVLRGRSTAVSVRLGKVESTESSEGDDVSLRVFVGKRVASVSANAGADPAALAERAVAMAKVSPEDLHQGLADGARGHQFERGRGECRAGRTGAGDLAWFRRPLCRDALRLLGQCDSRRGRRHGARL